jgi:Flp pilus assembly protein TadG
MRISARQSERGSTLVEFSIAALVFFIALFGVLEVARLLWTYNAIADGVRLGARFATMRAPNSAAAVRNVVRYGTASPAVGASPIVYGLTDGHIGVTYDNMGVRLGTVSVSVNNFSFQFLTLPNVFGASLTLPNYTVTLTAESAGCEPTLADPNPCD